MNELRRALGPRSVWLATVGAMVGSGVFTTPREIAGSLPSASWMAVVWIVGGLLSWIGALCLAELGASLPQSGGMVVYLRRAYGPVAAYLFSWAMLIVLIPASMGFFVRTAVSAASVLVHTAAQTTATPSFAERAVGACVIAVVASLNVRSVRTGAFLQNVLTAFKLTGIVIVAVLGWLHPNHASQPSASSLTTAGMATALIAVLWTYDGWAEPTSLAGEMRSPQRDLPRGLGAGVVFVIVLYLVVHGAFVRGLGIAAMAHANSPALALVQQGGVGSRAAVVIVSLLVTVSTLGACAIGLLTGSRVVYAAALEGLLPRFLAVLNGAGVPARAIVLSSAMGAVFVMVPSLRLGEVFVLGAWPFYALCAWGVVRLRRREPNLARPYRMWGYPVTPIVFVLTSVTIVLAAGVSHPQHGLISLGLIVGGLPLYPLVIRSQRATHPPKET